MNYGLAAVLVAASLQPWQWSDADRIAARAARLPELEIRGAKNPELFLRYELFQALIAALSDGRKVGDSPEFRETLLRITAEYRSLHAERLEIEDRARRTSPLIAHELRKRARAMDVIMCQSRAKALADAEAIYGQETFRRFLYTAIAPTIPLHIVRDEVLQRERWKWIEGGCR